MAKNKILYSDLVAATQKNLNQVGKIPTESVFKHTGKHWKEWVLLLEKRGARQWTYQELVAFLKKTHKLTPWWQQSVALGFEIATGKRQPGQDAKGRYGLTATKTLPWSTSRVWNFLISQPGVETWLQPLSPVNIRPKTPFETKTGFFGEIRTVTPRRRIRLHWQDPHWEKHTAVEIVLVTHPQKTILVINHTALPTPQTQSSLRIYWKQTLTSLDSHHF
jgi:uncharacterized protein YndB with AHSA1/START domain